MLVRMDEGVGVKERLMLGQWRGKGMYVSEA